MPTPDTDSLVTLGGIKQNYDQPVDPTTDVDALEWDIAMCNVAQATYVATNGWLRFTTATNTAGIILVNWRSTTMVNTTTAPAMAHATAPQVGVFTATLPPTVLDELNGIQNTYYPNYNPSHTTNVIRAKATAEGPYPLVTQVSFNANVITIYVFNLDGTYTDAVASGVGTTILVEWQ